MQRRAFSLLEVPRWPFLYATVGDFVSGKMSSFSLEHGIDICYTDKYICRENAASRDI